MKLISGILLLSLSLPVLSQDRNASLEAGKGVSREFLSRFGTPTGFQDNIVNPMLGSGELQTLDGRKSFSAPLTCGSDQSYTSVTLKIFPSGDIDLAEIQVDSNQDGSMDQILNNLPAMSGVCVNGYVSCDQGTWNNCKPFIWDASPTGVFAVSAASLLDVGSCHCLNDACAPNYSTLNFDSILRQVGAGISQALARRDYSLATTRVSVEGSTITYFGQAISKCMGTEVVAQTLYGNPNQISTNTTTTLEADLPESRIFSLMTTSPSANSAKNTVTYENCNITREPNLDEVSLFDIVSIGAGSATANLINANTVDITVGRIGDNYLNAGGCATFEQTAQLAIFRPDRIVSADLQHVKYDDHLQVILNDHLVWNGPFGNWTNITENPPTGPCERVTSNDLNSVSVDVLSSFPANPGTLDARLRVRVGKFGEGYARIRVGVNTECREGQDAIINSCEGFEKSNRCRLKDELTDGAVTMRSFARTGINLPARRTEIRSPTCSLTVTRPWLNILRTYECDGSTELDFDQAAHRVHTIESTTSPTEYEDVRSTQTGGPPESVSGTLSLFDEITVEPCTLQCKVRKVKHANEVTVFGVTAEELDENRNTQVEYRSCVENICEVESDEEILQNCACINGFNDVSVMMQLIRMGGSDMICSSGQRQNP